MEAARYVHVPGYSALVLRKAFSDLILPGALMDRAHEWWDSTDAEWNEQNHIWTFPAGSGNAKVAFGYLEHEKDIRRYNSAQFNCVCFDESTDFREDQFRFFFSRTRRLAGSNIPGRLRHASNPGGAGHDWIMNRYIIPYEEGKLEINKRFFIRATIEDNPHLDRDDYVESLEETDIDLREMILSGNWHYTPKGNKFRREWLDGHYLPTRPELRMAVRYWDLASTEAGKVKNPDWTRGALLGLTPRNEVVVCHVASIRSTPGEVEDFIAQTAEFDRANLRPTPYYVRMEQEPGSSGVNTISNYRRNVLQGYNFDGNRSTGSKEERFNGFAAQAEHGNVYAVQGAWVESWLAELESFPNRRYKDDQVDATSGGHEFLAGLTRRGRPAVKVIN